MTLTTTYRNQASFIAAYPTLHPAPDQDKLEVGDTIALHVSVSNGESLVAAAFFDAEVIGIDGDTISAIVDELTDVHMNKRHLPRPGDEIIVDRDNIITIRDKEGDVLRPQAQWDMFVVDARISSGEMPMVRATGGLPSSCADLSPADIANDNWSGIRFEAEGFSDGMPTETLHAYALLIHRPGEKNDTFLRLVSDRITESYVFTDGSWKAAA